MQENERALIMVDVQNDFCPGGALAVADGDKVVAPLNVFAAFVRSVDGFVFATRDWHPEITSHFKDYGGVWPKHCVQGTRGAEFHPDLSVEGAVIVSKGVVPDEDGFSGFEGVADVERVPLLSALQGRGITTLFIGGLATDYCVKATVLDAIRLGFRVYLLTDAIRSVDLQPDDGIRAIEEMTDAGAVTTTTEEAIRSLDK